MERGALALRLTGPSGRPARRVAAWPVQEGYFPHRRQRQMRAGIFIPFWGARAEKGV